MMMYVYKTGCSSGRSTEPSHVWRNRFTGNGRTGFGDAIVQHMGDTLTEKPRTEDDFCLIIC
jgi:hypothetical protein